MKHVIIFLGVLIFALVTSQFSVADAENPAELLKQISAINHTQSKTENKLNYTNSTDLFADTNPSAEDQAKIVNQAEGAKKSVTTVSESGK